MNMLTIALLGLLADDAQNAATSGTNEAATRPPAASGQATADSVVAAAFTKAIDTAKPELKAAQPMGTAAPATVVAPVELTNLAAPALAILGLAGLAFALTRRRRALPSSIRIVESASLGPKRSIVIAEVLGERMVLAVSEAGVSVLATKQLELAPEPSFPDVDVQPVSHAVPEMGFFERLMGRRGGAGRPKFEEVLGESIEDQELRAKLAAGLRGTVP